MSIWQEVRVDPNSPVSLAAQLSQQIKLLIASARLAPGAVLPPVRQLGEALGISFHTVRAAYQALERDGMVATRHGVGTTVLSTGISALSRPANAPPTFTIGVIIPAFTDFYAPLLQGIHAAAKADSILLFICDSQEDPTLAESYLDQLIARRVDGVLLVARELPNLEKLRYIHANPGEFPPVVTADIPNYPPPSILFDLENGAYTAARHLVEHGHQRIGILTAPVTWHNVAEMLRGFRRALTEADRTLPDDLLAVVPNFRLDSGVLGAQRLLDHPDPPTAILTTGDLLALGAHKAIKAHGLQIPGDLALVGIDDSQFATLVEPPLTSVNLPAYTMGEAAYSLLRKIIDGAAERSTQIRLETHLVVRQSCGCHQPG